MASLKERAAARLSALRARRPSVDHTVRMQQHYGAVKGSQQAGAVTYFAFLSFFPVLALAFAAVGYVARVYPRARTDVREAVNSVFPGFIGTEPGQISISDIENAAGAAIGIGVVGVLYAGLGWFSSMRDALLVVFELPDKEQPNFVVGKLRDLVALVVIGLVLFVAVAVTGFVNGFSDRVLDWVGLGDELWWLVWLVTLALGLAANALLFFVLFKLLAEPHDPKRTLWSGALLGAVGFEVLKQLSGVLLASTKGQPAFQAFGIALILVVWINYFSRVVLYAAAWAHTDPRSRARREEEELRRRSMEELTRVDLHEAPPAAEGADPSRASAARTFAAGSATALAVVAALRKKKDPS